MLALSYSVKVGAPVCVFVCVSVFAFSCMCTVCSLVRADWICVLRTDCNEIILGPYCGIWFNAVKEKVNEFLNLDFLDANTSASRICFGFIHYSEFLM